MNGVDCCPSVEMVSGMVYVMCRRIHNRVAMHGGVIRPNIKQIAKDHMPRWVPFESSKESSVTSGALMECKHNQGVTLMSPGSGRKDIKMTPKKTRRRQRHGVDNASIPRN